MTQYIFFSHLLFLSEKCPPVILCYCNDLPASNFQVTGIIQLGKECKTLRKVQIYQSGFWATNVLKLHSKTLTALLKCSDNMTMIW